jgi:translation initiation factor 2B subunit (eIF-2B alpha/beta/delta family)
MTFKSIFKKGVSLSQAGQASKHSRKASSYAKQAMNCFKQAKSMSGDKKIDKMLEGLNYLSNSILEVSDSITPISTMNATSVLLEENIQNMLNQSQKEIIEKLKKTK